MKLDYIIIYLILFLSFYSLGSIVGHLRRKNNTLVYFFISLIYSIIEGVRYGRGVDYWGYNSLYDRINTTTDATSGQVLFDQLLLLFKNLNIPFNGVLFLLSFLYIYSTLYLLKDYKKYFKYVLPLLLIFTVIESECFIRQFCSLSFANFALSFILKDNKNKKVRFLFFFIFTLIAYHIHSVSIIFLFISFITFHIKSPFHYKYTIPLYLVFSLSNNIIPSNILSEVINSISISESNKFYNYIENSDKWFGYDSINTIYRQHWYTLLLDIFLNISVFYTGYKIIKDKRISTPQSYIFFFNLYTIGAIMLRAFYEIELLRRVAFNEFLWIFLVSGYILYLYFNNKYRYNYLTITAIIISIYITLSAIRILFLTNLNNFIWDKNIW